MGREITENRGFSKAAMELYKKTGRKEIVLTETAAEALHPAGFYHGDLTEDAVELTLNSIE
ncbi:MAG: PaREP1 family protein, partial [Candidatus Bathyarchaeia archaeon]